MSDNWEILLVTPKRHRLYKETSLLTNDIKMDIATSHPGKCMLKHVNFD